MTDSKTISSLFDEEPFQWGLRGDPHLWRAMREQLKDTPVPSTADALIVIIEETFEALTQHPITSREHFYVERFNHGGMSAGYIDPGFWRRNLIPMLCKRFDQSGR